MNLTIPASSLALLTLLTGTALDPHPSSPHASTVPALQSATLPLPPNYKTTFENPDILVMRVHYAAHEFVPMHDHSAYPTIYVYLSDSGVVEIRHEGPDGEVVKRPPTHTGAFRIAPGIAERHSVTNLSDTDSDFLRVELKSIPPDDIKKVFRGEVKPLPYGTYTEYEDKALRVERIICPPTGTCNPAEPVRSSLLIAINASSIDKRKFNPGDVFLKPELTQIAKPGPILGTDGQFLRVTLLYSK